VWNTGVRISGLNGLGGGDDPRIGGEGKGSSLGFGCGDTGLPAGLASGAAQYPQNTMPSALFLPHCLHAGIRSPWLHYQIFPQPANQRKSEKVQK
jgi:hypothetical protein